MDQNSSDTPHSSDPRLNHRDTGRFFVENRQIAWVLLIGTLVWGVFAYLRMPKRKDPEVPVHLAVALCPWPGSRPDRVEELVTRIDAVSVESTRNAARGLLSRSRPAVVALGSGRGLDTAVAFAEGLTRSMAKARLH